MHVDIAISVGLNSTTHFVVDSGLYKPAKYSQRPVARVP